MALLGLVARIAGLRADSPNRAGYKPGSHGKTFWVTHAATGPASSACWGPARAHWGGERGPGHQDLLTIIEAFSLLGQKRIPLRRMNYKANCCCLSSKARRLGKGSFPVRKASKDSQAVCSRRLQCSSVSRYPPTLPGASRGGTQPPLLSPLFAAT